MSDRTERTAYQDAPLSAAKHPDPRVLPDADGQARESDVLVGRTVSINCPRTQLFAFWRDFRNLPRFMENIHSITVNDERRSHWVVAAPGGSEVEWDSEITEEQPDHLIAWQSTPGSNVRHSGRIEFRDSTNGRGTVVTATIIYDPPGGGFGQALAKLFQREPKVQARRDLRRFKQLMETGEISTSEPPAAAPRA
jgi:uncharacterized membrane protein